MAKPSLKDRALQPSVNGGALLEEVELLLSELESLCGSLERALMRRRWGDLETAIADSRRVTHALQNAMHDALAVRTPEFDERIFSRISRIGAIRQNQMARLQQYHGAVGERLRLMARWKSALRSMAGAPPARLQAVDGLS